jgi:hypothetical protein
MPAAPSFAERRRARRDPPRGPLGHGQAHRSAADAASARGGGGALATFKATRDANAVAGYRERVRAFEELMGYREFAERARRNERPRS